MEFLNWLGGRWFELFQTFGLIATLLFTAHTIRRDERARKVSNLIDIAKLHRKVWRDAYEHPVSARLFEKDVNLEENPITQKELLFTKQLVLLLSIVYQADRAGMLVELEGLESDVREFFDHPIPREVWKRMKPYQNKDFVNFVETALSLA